MRGATCHPHSQHVRVLCHKVAVQVAGILNNDFKTAVIVSDIVQEGEDIRQKNEGKWEFTLQDSANGAAVELDVEIGRYMDTSLVKADVQPLFVRLLIKVQHMLHLTCATVELSRSRITYLSTMLSRQRFQLYVEALHLALRQHCNISSISHVIYAYAQRTTLLTLDLEQLSAV